MQVYITSTMVMATHEMSLKGDPQVYTSPGVSNFLHRLDSGRSLCTKAKLHMLPGVENLDKPRESGAARDNMHEVMWNSC